MLKWNALLDAAVVGAALVVSTAAVAQVPAAEIHASQTVQPVSDLATDKASDLLSPEASAMPSTGEQISAPQLQTPSSTIPDTSGSVAQVTSVSQLSDVDPNSWAFQALQSLIERYGCIAGYSDGTFRGNRATTRYEFAAELYACLNRLSERLGSVSPEDLAALRRLQEEFASEIASLRGKVDALETRTTELEANQFSTTTKLTGEVYFNVTGAFADGPVLAEGQTAFRTQPRTATPLLRRITTKPNVTFSDYVFLNFNTSFSGKDSLVIQLAAGNGDSPANVFASAGLFNTFGVPFTDQKGVVGPNNNIGIRELFYSFPAADAVQIVAGPRVNWYRYFDNNRFTFYKTGASSFNASGSTILNAVDRGSGAAVLWEISDQLDLHVAYLGSVAKTFSTAKYSVVLPLFIPYI